MEIKVSRVEREVTLTLKRATGRKTEANEGKGSLLSAKLVSNCAARRVDRQIRELLSNSQTDKTGPPLVRHRATRRT